MNFPKLRSPVLLVHGLLGFDELKVCGWKIASYFPGITEALRAAGNRVMVPRLSPTGGVDRRAAQLKAYLDRHAPGEPVHILAHSMGGLDARYMVSRLGMAPRVLTLTTFGTPHRGTSFADWGIRRLERVLKPLFNFFDIPGQAFYDLTTTNCCRFNEVVPDAPGVRYFSVVGRHGGDWRSTRWRLFQNIVHRAEGDNDGIVSMASAKYGEDCDVWDGDHLSLVNWPNPTCVAGGRWYDRTPKYGQLVGRLKDEGF
jgi:triacylglycerol lipase